jgi:hypothetical protein
MVETAAHRTDHVFLWLPVRQWVLSVPKRLRYFMQRDGAALNMVLRVFLRVIAQSLQTHCPGAASQHERGRTWSDTAGPCHPTHASACTTQTVEGALPVGGVDRPHLRSVPALVPDVRWTDALDRVHYRGHTDQEDP